MKNQPSATFLVLLRNYAEIGNNWGIRGSEPIGVVHLSVRDLFVGGSTMNGRLWLIPPVAVALLFVVTRPSPTPACCPVGKSGKPVANADQTVIIIWDAAAKTQHFIRKASFKSEGDDFGFLVPSPTRPELSESGNEAFPYLQKITEPEVQKKKASSGIGCGLACGDDKSKGSRNDKDKAQGNSVRVLEEKLVAGFNAVVLEADSTDDLVTWLTKREYTFSPEVRAWVKPYVEAGWKITALKVAQDHKAGKDVSAASLRMTFKTDRPLFPYREPDIKSAAELLNLKNRLLRIYFLADARYQGNLTEDTQWTGRVAWANKLSAGERARALEMLNLPETTGPGEWFLTEFEDKWAYQAAPADVTFARAEDQGTVRRPPIIEYVSTSWPIDVTALALAGLLVGPTLVRRMRKRF
jgi:hypothetical protein